VPSLGPRLDEGAARVQTPLGLRSGTPGGVGSNPGFSVYSREGRDPGWQPTQGSVGTRAGLPVPGRLSLPTPRKVGRWVGDGSPEPAPAGRRGGPRIQNPSGAANPAISAGRTRAAALRAPREGP
jgi:hypothetical protein